MTLKTYLPLARLPLRQATLVFLLGSHGILLSMKKRGFGQGRWNGVGGKRREAESIVEAAVRETEEEIGVTPLLIQDVGCLDFYFPHTEEWNQQVVVFVSQKWKGTPSESDEMRPQWFSYHDIPYQDMWPDDVLWLPPVLDGKMVHASFLFGEGDVIEDYAVEVTDR